MRTRQGEHPFSAWGMAVAAMREIEREGFAMVWPSEPSDRQRALLDTLGVAVWVSPAIGARPMVMTPAEFERFVRAYVAAL